MNPEPQFIHHLIYRPKRPKPHVMVGAAQQEMYHLQLISKVDEREWERSAAGKGWGGYQAAAAEDEKEKEKEGGAWYDIKKQKWTVQFLDFPEAMRTRPVTTRSMYLAEAGDGDVLAFMEDFGYTYVYLKKKKKILFFFYRLLITDKRAESLHLPLKKKLCLRICDLRI